MTKYVNERDPVVLDPHYIGPPDLRSDRLWPICHQIGFARSLVTSIHITFRVLLDRYLQQFWAVQDIRPTFKAATKLDEVEDWPAVHARNRATNLKIRQEISKSLNRRSSRSLEHTIAEFVDCREQ